MIYSYMFISNWFLLNVLLYCNLFKYKWNFEFEKVEFYGIFFNFISVEINISCYCWWDYFGVYDKVYMYKWIGMESLKIFNYVKNLGFNCEIILGDVYIMSY